MSYARTITIKDVLDSFGHYFWDVIGVGFVLWLPLMALDMGTQQNPNGPLISYAVMLLIFILLNPAPEIIYQVPHDSPLDVFKRAYDFVLENWIEWFLPMVVLLLPLVAAPGGLTSFFLLSHRVGRGAGLDFSQILIVPFTILGSWFRRSASALSWLSILSYCAHRPWPCRSSCFVATSLHHCLGPPIVSDNSPRNPRGTNRPSALLAPKITWLGRSGMQFNS